jgi:hypothetical protein
VNWPGSFLSVHTRVRTGYFISLGAEPFGSSASRHNSTILVLRWEGIRIVRRNPFWPGRRTDDWRVIRRLARRQRSITVSCAGLSSGVDRNLVRQGMSRPSQLVPLPDVSLPRKRPDCCEHAKRREGPNSELNALIRSPRQRELAAKSARVRPDFPDMRVTCLDTTEHPGTVSLRNRYQRGNWLVPGASATLSNQAGHDA